MKAPPWLLTDTADLRPGEIVRLEAAEAQHAVGPLRRRTGDPVVLIDGCGRAADAVLFVGRSRTVEAEIVAVRSEPPESTPAVNLALAVLDGRTMEWAIQKAVEIGVARLVPVVTDRTQLDRRRIASKLHRWRQVALQSLKQCHRMWAMQVDDPESFATLLDQATIDRSCVVADRGGVIVAALPPTESRTLLVGPEGGFSDVEEAAISKAGWCRVRLGRHVLRSETAALVGAAALLAVHAGRDGVERISG